MNVNRNLQSATLLIAAACFWWQPSIQAQPDAAWKVQAPAEALTLVRTDPFTVGSLRFTLQNVSNRTIIECRISSPNGMTTGIDPILNGRGSVAPGETFSMFFSENDFQSKSNIDRTLKVDALIYTDGSTLGDPTSVSDVVARMIGTALETKRVADILTNIADPTASGLEVAAAEIDKMPLSPHGTAEEALSSVRGVALPNVRQAYVDKYVARQSPWMAVGIQAERQIVLRAIANVKELAQQPESQSIAEQKRTERARDHGCEDLALRWRELSAMQSQILDALDRTLNSK